MIKVRKAAERKFPEFFDFLSRIFPRILLRIFPEFFEEFSCFVSWETETRKKFTKHPRHFSMQNSQANTKKKITKFFWRAGKLTMIVLNEGIERAEEPGSAGGSETVKKKNVLVAYTSPAESKAIVPELFAGVVGTFRYNVAVLAAGKSQKT